MSGGFGSKDKEVRVDIWSHRASKGYNEHNFLDESALPIVTWSVSRLAAFTSPTPWGSRYPFLRGRADTPLAELNYWPCCERKCNSHFNIGEINERSLAYYQCSLTDASIKLKFCAFYSVNTNKACQMFIFSHVFVQKILTWIFLCHCLWSPFCCHQIVAAKCLFWHLHFHKCLVLKIEQIMKRNNEIRSHDVCALALKGHWLHCDMACSWLWFQPNTFIFSIEYI